MLPELLPTTRTKLYFQTTIILSLVRMYHSNVPFSLEAPIRNFRKVAPKKTRTLRIVWPRIRNYTYRSRFVKARRKVRTKLSLPGPRVKFLFVFAPLRSFAFNFSRRSQRAIHGCSCDFREIFRRRDLVASISLIFMTRRGIARITIY